MSIFDYYWALDTKNDFDYTNIHNGPKLVNSKLDFGPKPQFTYLEDMPFKDFMFVCTDGEVKAHRNILWTRCAFFKPRAWNTNAIFELKVDFTVETVRKVIYYIYGSTLNIYDPIDLDAYKFLNMLNPSPNNVDRLIPANQESFEGMLDVDLETAGIEFETIIKIMANYVLNAYYINIHKSEYSLDLPIEVVEDMLDSEYVDGSESDILYYINEYVYHNAVTDVTKLCSKIKWEYVDSIRDMPLAIYIKKCVPRLTKEQIREVYVNDPYYRIGYLLFIDIVKGYTDKTNIVEMYNKGYITALDKKYKIRNLFSREEFDELVK